MYQYDKHDDILVRLDEIERLLRIVAGLVTKEQYLQEMAARAQLEREISEGDATDVFEEIEAEYDRA